MAGNKKKRKQSALNRFILNATGARKVAEGIEGGSPNAPKTPPGTPSISPRRVDELRALGKKQAEARKNKGKRLTSIFRRGKKKK